MRKTVDGIHIVCGEAWGALTLGPRHKRRGGGTKYKEECSFVLGLSMHTTSLAGDRRSILFQGVT